MPQQQAPRYAVVIQWSEEDRCYVASFPEWRDAAYAGAHGDTYEEAAKNAREVLELMMEPVPGESTVLPEPKLYQYPGPDLVDVPDEATRRPDLKQVKQTA